MLHEYQYTKEELENICNQSNQLETLVVKAENELLEKQKDFLISASHRKEPAVIIDISPHGIVVQLLNYLLEKRIHISKLSSDRLVFDEQYKMLHNNNILYKMGDIIDIVT